MRSNYWARLWFVIALSFSILCTLAIMVGSNQLRANTILIKMLNIRTQQVVILESMCGPREPPPFSLPELKLKQNTYEETL